MIKAREIIEKLKVLAPLNLACSWDNPGLLLGSPEKEVKKIYITLDADMDAVDYAISENVDLIITHHPLIFSPLKHIVYEEAIGKKLIKLIKNEIAVYSMHTNFDAAHGGMGDIVAKKLGLKVLEGMEYIDKEDEYAIGFVSDLTKPLSAKELAKKVKDCFNLPFVSVSDSGKMISRLAVCPGSGRSMVKDAIKLKADCFITGDMGHHEALDLLEEGISLIDAGHYGLEEIFVSEIYDYLDGEFDVEIMKAERKFLTEII